MQSGRISKLYNYSYYFLETAHYLQDILEGKEGKWLRSYYFDNENIVGKLGTGNFYSKSYFSEDMVEEKLLLLVFNQTVEKWNKADQYQLYIEAIEWFRYRESEINELCFK